MTSDLVCKLHAVSRQVFEKNKCSCY